MIKDKENYLRKESKQLELSKDGGLFEVDTNYMTGYREGMKTGYNEALSNLEEIIKATKAIGVTASNFKSINELSNDYVTANVEKSKIIGILEVIDRSDDEEIKKFKPTYEHYSKEWDKIIDGLEESKEKMLELEKTLIELKYKEEFIYLPYETELEDTSVSLSEAKEILVKLEPTDERIDTCIKMYKSDYGMYMDLGRDEEEKLSNELIDQWYSEKDKYYNFVQDELKEIYKSRENTSKREQLEV